MSDCAILGPRPILTHYSRDPLGPIQSVSQHRRESDKPAGLWVSVDVDGEGWADWCRGEEFRLGHLACRYRVDLAASARILWIGSAQGIDHFNLQFGRTPEWSRYYRSVRWGEVAALYQGIVIAPYCWGRRLSNHCAWYYGWDCASGCIWDAAAIEAVTLLEVEPAPATTVERWQPPVAGGAI